MNNETYFLLYVNKIKDNILYSVRIGETGLDADGDAYNFGAEAKEKS